MVHFVLTNFGVYEGNIYDDDATISTPHRECDKICNYPERYINENLPMKQETKKSFFFI